MIKYKVKFQVFHGTLVGVPQNLRYNQFFRCDFSTGAHYVICQIVYLGKDVVMKENTWYNGYAYLIGAEEFPPIGNKYLEYIDISMTYNLHVGIDVIGKCKLIEMIEIIEDQ